MQHWGYAGIHLYLHLPAIYAYTYCYRDSDGYGQADAHCPTSHNTKGAALTTTAPVIATLTAKLKQRLEAEPPRGLTTIRPQTAMKRHA